MLSRITCSYINHILRAFVHVHAIGPLILGHVKKIETGSCVFDAWDRASEADDIMLSGVEIKKIALDIEGELFDYYGTTSTNYRNKYRTILFYVKDPKNPGFFRRSVAAVTSHSSLVIVSLLGRSCITVTQF